MFIKVHDTDSTDSTEVIVNTDTVEQVIRMSEGNALICLTSGDQVRTEERYSDIILAVIRE